MILTLWVALSTAGLVTFVLGHVFGFHGIAAIGAVMVILVGGEIGLTGMEIKDGHTINRTHTTVQSDKVVLDNSTQKDTYTKHSWTRIFSSDHALGLGILQMLIGVLLFYQQMLAIGEGQ